MNLTMRDGTIDAAFKRLQQAVSHDVANLTRLATINRTRQGAIEKMLFGSRFALLKLMVMQILSPENVRYLVDSVHGKEMVDFDAVMRNKQNGNGNIRIL